MNIPWTGPILYIAATPLGNLSDSSERLQTIFRTATMVICEDSRRTKTILAHFGISARSKKWISYQDYREQQLADKIIEKIIEENAIAVLVSDAGTPCLSDPGYRLVKSAHEKKLRVSPIPGPSSVSALVSISGLPSDRFSFVGFLPRKKSEVVAEIRSWRHTTVFFDSLRRLGPHLKIIGSIYPSAQLCIGRELTKLHEEVVRGSIAEIESWIGVHPVLRGEVSVACFPDCNHLEVVDGEQKQSSQDTEAIILNELKKDVSIKEIMQKFGPKSNFAKPRSWLYQFYLKHKKPRN